VAYFGPSAGSVLLPEGSLDRKGLGSIIFNDEVKRRRLNSIFHPAVHRAMLWGILTHWFRWERFCILDVPLLIEGSMWKWLGKCPWSTGAHYPILNDQCELRTAGCIYSAVPAKFNFSDRCIATVCPARTRCRLVVAFIYSIFNSKAQASAFAR